MSSMSVIQCFSDVATSQCWLIFFQNLRDRTFWIFFIFCCSVKNSCLHWTHHRAREKKVNKPKYFYFQVKSDGRESKFYQIGCVKVCLMILLSFQKEPKFITENCARIFEEGNVFYNPVQEVRIEILFLKLSQLAQVVHFSSIVTFRSVFSTLSFQSTRKNSKTRKNRNRERTRTSKTWNLLTRKLKYLKPYQRQV